MSSGATQTDSAAELRAEVERLKVENCLLRGESGDLRQRISDLAYLIMRVRAQVGQLERALEK